MFRFFFHRFTVRIRTNGRIRVTCVANHLHKSVHIKRICLRIAMSIDSHALNVTKNSNNVNSKSRNSQHRKSMNEEKIIFFLLFSL